jgi:phosphomannomutase
VRVPAVEDHRLDAVFKAYDIRGTVPDQLDEDVARGVGAAFARFVASPAVVVGRDMRPTGIPLLDAFSAGVMSTGTDVIDLGLASTDLVYVASGRLDLPGAMLTASHNPAGYNGIKLCGAGAAAIGTDSGLADIRSMAAAGWDPCGATGRRSARDFLAEYVAHVHSFVDIASLAPLRVVADCANGMGGLVAPAVFAGLAPSVELLFPELDGTFPNHPADPIDPDNLRDLQARVLQTGAHLGMAFDGDADRVFLVDEQARAVSGSVTTALVATGVLAREPGATILHNLICSRAVPEVVRENGGTPVRTKVGHSYIKAIMAETGAAFGGEHSGHYYFRDNYRADSGLIAALVVLEQLSAWGGSMSELLAPLDRYAASGEINTTVDDRDAAIEVVAAAFAGRPMDRLDGLTVDCGDWWFNLRPSNTEPLLRLNLEAPDPVAVARHVGEVRALYTRS